MSSDNAVGNSSQAPYADPDKAQHAPRLWNLRLLTNLIIISLPFTLLGYDISITGPLLALPLFIKKYQPELQSPAFTAKNLNLIVSVPICGGIVALVVAPSMLWRIGRKRTLLVGYLGFCAPGSLIQLFASDMAALVCGLVVKNVGLGLVSLTAPLYLSEMVPADSRGRAIGLCTLATISAEILGATVVWGSEKLTNKFQYKLPFAIEVSLTCVYGLITILVLESPVWYLLRNRNDEAEAALKLLRSNDSQVMRIEFATLRRATLAAQETRTTMKFYDIFNRENLTRTLVAAAYRPFDLVSGRALATTFGTVILVQSGVADAFRINILINCLSLVGQMVGSSLIDKIGRRPVVLQGMLALLVLNVSIGTLAAVGLTSRSREQALAALLIILQFVVVLTFGSIIFLLPVELPMTKLREPTIAWAQLSTTVTYVAVNFTVPQMIAPDAGNLGAKAAFGFGGCNLLMLIFSYFNLPETKGITISDIDTLYAAKVPARRWTSYKERIEQLHESN